MQLILISKSPGKHVPVRIGTAGVLALLLLAACAGGGLLYGGSVVGEWYAPEQPDFTEALMREELRRQRARLELAIAHTEDDVDALALRLGELQAHVARLDALGERLVDMADLDAAEFDFDSPPARGGPQDPSTLTAPSMAELFASLDALAVQLEDRAPKLTALESLLMNEKLRAEVYPAGRPVERGWISSGYGLRVDPLTGRKAFHAGVDFAGPSQSSVVAVAAGVVIRSGYMQDMGNLIEINHGNGYVTRYAHNKKNLVKVGQTVKKGEPIALLGASGRSTGPHVHFEVLHDGKPVDPIQHVRAKL